MTSKLPIVTTALLLSTATAHADLLISSKPTKNVSCNAGVCTATAEKAVLNVGELQTMLASGDTTVKAGGGAPDIVVKAAFSWTTPSELTLVSVHLVEFDRTVTVAGQGAVTIRNGGVLGEDLRFLRPGRIDFFDLSSRLKINGVVYRLVRSIRILADRIAANPNASIAFAKDYNAKQDGSY